MKKITLALAWMMAIFSQTLLAQTDSSTTSATVPNNVVTPTEATSTSNVAADFYTKLKDGPVHLNILSGVESMKTKEGEDYVYGGYSTFHLGTVSGNITENDHLSGTIYFRTDDAKDAAGTQEWYRAYITYNHKFLKQSDVGFDLKGEMYVRYLPTYKRRNDSSNNGMLRPAMSVSRAFDNGLYLSSKIHYAHNIAKSGRNDLEGRGTGYIYLITTQSYSFTEKLSVTFLQEWAHYYNKGTTEQEAGDMIGTLELGYQFHPQVYAGIYTTGYMMAEHDDKLMYEDFVEQMTYGFNVSLNVF